MFRAHAILATVSVCTLGLACQGASSTRGGKEGADGGKAESGPQVPEEAAEKKPPPKPPKDRAVKVGEYTFHLPAGVTAPPPIPPDNPMTEAKVALGERLFFDPRLSVDGSRSCYGCHHDACGNADCRPKALGAKEKPLPRNTPTIWNVAFRTSLYWDGRAPSLEKQAVGALKGGNMGLGDGLSAKAAEIGALPEYAAAFREVFGLAEKDPVTPDHVAKALAAYERTLLCGNTKFDRRELSPAAERGWKLFAGKAGCITCHRGPDFTDEAFHNVGVGVPAGSPAAQGADRGRFAVTKAPADAFRFRTPTLRNVARTAPYFHDGSVDSLEEAVRIMASGGRPVPGRDPLLTDRRLSDAEVSDLVAFLEALTCPGRLEREGGPAPAGLAPKPEPAGE